MKLSFATALVGWSASVVPGVRAAYDIGFHDDNDLTSFVTRPDIRAPLFNVDYHQRERVAPGYWFVAPYGNIKQETFARRYYQACQTGPAIYDSNGELVWTGACAFRNQNACDFRLVEDGDSVQLSAILMSEGEDYKGEGTILDSSYSVVKRVTAPKLINSFNMHEFKVIEGGKSSLSIIYRPEWVELDEELNTELQTGWIGNAGFREVDVETGNTTFEWWAFPEVRPQESKVEIGGLEGPHPVAWNWFHMNSVEKNSAGDYMVSSRFTDTIFKISGKTGKLEWRLEGSGKTSDFALQGFNFSRQHDARWVEHSEEREVITLLDNAADTASNTSTHSSVLMIELDKTSTPWTASVLKRWVRPDLSLSRLRGNAQLLDGGNIFTCWSDNSYLTEHSADGDLLMNATFRSNRFVTYRGYKFNFTGAPQEAPALKATAHGATRERSTTTIHVSWNGATEVASWSFYSASYGNELLGTKRKTGFETSFHAEGYTPAIYAEALAADGSVLGRTAIIAVDPVAHWPGAVAMLVQQQPGLGPVPATENTPVGWQKHAAGNSNVAESVGCSIYGSGCQPPVIPQQLLDIVPTEKYEL